MAAFKVDTLFIETSKYSFSSDIVYEDAVGKMLDTAHRRGIKVVAWYLAGFSDMATDFRRARAAIEYTSPGGEEFDAFALNIEEVAIADHDVRNRRTLRLSRRIKRSVPDRYPIAAIVPDPVNQRYWPAFPYKRIGEIYDLVMPMTYWSYREVDGAAAVRRFVSDNIRVLRRKARNKRLPVHVPGGLALRAFGNEVNAFARAVRKRNALGGGLYDFPLTRRSQWPRLRSLSLSR
jgi:hypothetical protein